MKDTTKIENMISLKDLLNKSLQEKVEDIAPNFRKNMITEDQIEKIIQSISFTLKVSPDKVLVGIILLFLQGAASSAAPLSMSIDFSGGKSIEKRNLVNACNLVTGHSFIRRIAESLAQQIGEFAYHNKLKGELANRINNRYRAETGDNLTDLEMAYCSSFSQHIPNLQEITSERLVKLLAEDYQSRFDTRKKSVKWSSDAISNKISKRKKNSN